jgi:hypothetical protein
LRVGTKGFSSLSSLSFSLSLSFGPIGAQSKVRLVSALNKALGLFSIEKQPQLLNVYVYSLYIKKGKKEKGFFLSCVFPVCSLVVT